MLPRFAPTSLLRRLATDDGRLSSDPAEYPTPDEISNGRLLRVEAPFNSLALGSLPSFYALFAIQMGATNSMVGWLTSGPALLNLLCLLPIGRLVERASSLRNPMALGHASHRVALLALACVPFLPPALRPWGVILLVTLASLPIGIWGVSFDAAAAEMFSSRHFARFFGQRWAVANVSNIVSVFVLGALIDRLPFPLNFQLVIAGVALLTLASVAIVRRMRLPEKSRPPAAGEETRSLAGFIRYHRGFFVFEAGIAVAYLAAYMALPLFRIYWVRDLGATGAWVGALAASFSLGAILGNLFWGRRSRAERDRRTWLAGSLGIMGLYPLLTAAVGSLAPLLVVCLFAGFFSSANDLMMFKRLIQLLPVGQRATFMSFHNLFMNAMAFVGPLISTRLADEYGLRTVLMGVGMLGIAGALLLHVIAWHRPAALDAAVAGAAGG